MGMNCYDGRLGFLFLLGSGGVGGVLNEGMSALCLLVSNPVSIVVHCLRCCWVLIRIAVVVVRLLVGSIDAFVRCRTCTTAMIYPC